MDTQSIFSCFSLDHSFSSITFVLAPESITTATSTPPTVLATVSGGDADFTVNTYSSSSSLSYSSCRYLIVFFSFDFPSHLGFGVFVLHCEAKWSAPPHFAGLAFGRAPRVSSKVSYVPTSVACLVSTVPS